LQRQEKAMRVQDPVEKRVEIETLERLFLNSYVAETGEGDESAGLGGEEGGDRDS